jgi:hypothetical protein
MPTRSRTAAALLCSGRIAFAAGLLAVPARLTEPWLGPLARQDAAQIPMRGLAIRELGLGAGGLLAAVTGAPVRPWLVAQAAGDLTDLAATVVGGGGVPDGAVDLVAAIGVPSALLSAVTAVAVDA